MLLSSLILALLPITLAKKSRCLHSGSERQINEAFAKGGKGAVVTLCPGSVHRLNASVAFTAGRQTLTTEGDPKGRERAMLIVEGEQLATAIEADCDTCSHSTIESLIIDGNRPQLLRIPKGGALIETGNGEGQTVRNCRLYEPRGWSALHFREGNRKQCKTGLVQDNEIGPCGEEWDDDYDGDMTSKPLWGFPNADGISVACADTIVERNTIFDTTDGAIVIFGSRGSEVRHNHIFSRTRVILGGINLVDYDPFAGDFTNVQVHHNTLHALSAFLKVGIVAGPSSWSDDTETTVHGASITDNTLTGQHFGYGIVVSSAKDFAVLRNKVDDDAVFSGVDGPRCPRAPANSPPRALLINKGSASGVFQDDFKNGEVQHIICINPPPVDGKVYKPWRLRDSPESIAAGEAAHPELTKTTFDSKLADAVVAYQMTLLGAVDNLIHRIESRQHGELPEDSVLEAKTGIQELDELSDDFAELENLDHTLKEGLGGVEGDMKILVDRWKDRMDINKPSVLYIYNTVAKLIQSKAESEPQSEIPAPPTQEKRDSIPIEEGLGRVGVVSVGGVLGFVGWAGARRWRAGRVGKSSKLV